MTPQQASLQSWAGLGPERKGTTPRGLCGPRGKADQAQVIESCRLRVCVGVCGWVCVCVWVGGCDD